VLLHGAHKGAGRFVHYDLLEFAQPDGTWSPSFELPSSTESHDERVTRWKSYIPFCDEHQLRAQQERQEQLTRDEELARQIAAAADTPNPHAVARPAATARDGSTKSPWRPPMPRRAGAIPAAARRAFDRPPALSATLTFSASSIYVPSATRANVWRVIPTHCRGPFLSLVQPLFEAYGRYSSAGDLLRCAEIVHLILDLPAQSLLKGGRVREFNQVMRKHALQWTAALSSIQTSGSCASAAPSTNARVEPSSASTPPAATTTAAAATAPGPAASSLVAAASLAESSAAVVAEAAVDSVDELVSDTAQVDDAEARTVERCVRIMQEGGPRCISRAARTLMQAPLAPVTDQVVQQLRALHPTATSLMQPIPDNRSTPLVAVDQGALLRILKRRVNNGAAPGPSGWTGSHLQTIAESGSKDSLIGLTMLVQDLCNGVFCGSTQQRLLASILTPLSKPGNGIRPIAMGETFVKLAAHYLMSLIEPVLPSLFPRIQYGVKRAGGSESAAQLTRAAIAQSRVAHPDTIALKTDFANAFNSVSRVKVWDTLLSHPTTERIWRMFHWAYSPPSPLLVYDHQRFHVALESSDGVRQGDPFAGLGFALSVQPLYEEALAGQPDCHAFSIHDDITIIGPREQVFKCYDKIRAISAEKYGLKLRVDKCAVYLPPTLDSTASAAARADCAARQLPHASYLESLGVMFGDDATVAAHCHSTVAGHEQFFHLLSHPAMPAQVAFTLLRFCGLPRLSYLARTTQPRHLKDAAIRFDSMARACFLQIMQLDAAELSSEVESQLTLPLSAGGMGLRPVERFSHSAYFASLATVMPDFVRSFPSARLSDTAVHEQLIDTWQHMRRQGVGATTTTAAAATRSPVKAPAAAAATTIIVARAATPAAVTPAAAVTPPTFQAPPGLTPSQQIALHFNTLIQSVQADLTAAAATTAAAAAAASSVNAAATLSPPASRAPSSAASASTSSAPPPRLACTLRGGDDVVDRLWRRAQAYADKWTIAPSVDSFLQDEQLQSVATQQIEEKLFKQLHAQAGAFRRTLLTSLTAPHSSEHLTVLPTEPAYRIADSALRLSVRHRLGLAPSDSLSKRQCVCKSRAAFATDPDHLHSCRITRGSSLTLRHDSIVQVISDLARECGFHTIREPNDHIRPTQPATEANATAAAAASQLKSATTATSAAAASASSSSSSSSVDSQASQFMDDAIPHFHRHADLLLLKGDLQLYLDVAITRSTKSSSLSNSTLTQTVPLHSTHSVAALKTRKYAAISAINHYTFFPFVMETYGGVAKDAVRLLSILAKYSPLRSEREFMRHAHSRLAVCLQQSNANIALLGQQRMHVRRHAPSVAQQYTQRSARYIRPADTDELESRSAITLHAAQVHAQREDDAAAEHLPPFRHVYSQADIAAPAATTDEDDNSSSDNDSSSSSNHTSNNSPQLQVSSAPRARSVSFQLLAPAAHGPNAMSCE